MTSTRRRFLTGIAAAAVAGAQPRVRTGPILCLDTRLLPDVEYPDLAPILNGLGFDGCDLSVQPGGTLAPAQSSVDLVRAVEIIRGKGLDLPVMTTSFLSIVEPWARNVLAIAGGSDVTFFRTGYSSYTAARLMERRNEIRGLAAYGRAAGLVMGVPYPAGETLSADLDPQWTGWDYDTALAGNDSIAAALPRVRMFVLRDIRQQDRAPCPLGEGFVNWGGFFNALAKARFAGPLTLRVDYHPQDMVEAIRRDLAFARKMLNAAYEKELAPPA